MTATQAATGTRPVVSELPARRHRVRRPFAVAVMLLVLAELLIRVDRPALAEPQAWPTPELQHKYDRIRQLASHHHNADIVLVGDSMMDAGGDPNGLGAAVGGATVFNASLAGETLPTLIDWTSKVVVPRVHPKVVVIGLSSNSLNPNVPGAAGLVNAYRTSRVVQAAEGSQQPVDRLDSWLRQHSMLYRYRSVLRHPFGIATGTKAGQVAVFDPPLSPSGQDLAFAPDSYLHVGGFTYTHDEIRSVVADDLLNRFAVSPAKASELGGLVTGLRRRGIQVIVVAMPVTADFVSFHPNGDVDYQQALAAYAAVAHQTGARFLEPGVWSTSLFADPVHLNGLGAAAFTAFLAPILQQGGPAAAGK